MFRNESTFYKRKCDLCGVNMVTIFSPDKPYKVYCQPCWWSDKWEATEYATDYDPSRNFFDQYRELQEKVPYMSLINTYSTLENSEYVNHAGSLKNCYLIFNADFNENVMYSRMVNHVKDSMDADIIGDSELCYGVINCGKCYKTFFSEDCTDCSNVYFSKNLSGCTDCFGCVNLRNKSYHIFNEPYTKEEYEKRVKEFGFDSYKNLSELKKKALEFWNTHPQKYMHGLHNVNSTGDYVYESKNLQDGYQARFVEDGKYVQWTTLVPIKDVYDYTEWGNGAELIYDSITIGEGAKNIRFSFADWSSLSDIDYSMFCISSSNLFGCVGMRNKKNCILNKEYSEEEYKKLRAQIIEDMEKNPYVDAKGRIWKYGEFFPYDLSLFDYNEASCTDYYRLTKEEVLERGFRWREPEPNEHQVTMPSEKIPDSIKEVDDSILKEVLGCSSCSKAFKMTPAELKLLKEFGFPLPRKCWQCRHIERMDRINPPKFWDRKCDKCGVDLRTAYSPDRPEKIYCEKCYQSEVV